MTTKTAATTTLLSSVRFTAGDVLILQASDDSPLIRRPPSDYYQKLLGTHSGTSTAAGEGKLEKRTSSYNSLLSAVKKLSTGSLFEQQDTEKKSSSLKSGNASLRQLTNQESSAKGVPVDEDYEFGYDNNGNNDNIDEEPSIEEQTRLDIPYLEGNLTVSPFSFKRPKLVSR